MNIKRRLIFVLLYADGYFWLSRNFRLQKVGDIQWLEKNYNLRQTAHAIDELIVLNVSRHERPEHEFCDILRAVVRNVFVPVSAGGWIRSMATAQNLLLSGADKIVVNTALSLQPELVSRLVAKYGSQCIVGEIDFQNTPQGYIPKIERGSTFVDMSLGLYLKMVQALKVGEVILNSIDRDGTGFGYDLDSLAAIPENFSLPVIIAGGAGNSSHFATALHTRRVDAVATANIFNFVGSGLRRARERLVNDGFPIARILPVTQ